MVQERESEAERVTHESTAANAVAELRDDDGSEGRRACAGR
jgi:hypothetical protein